MRKMAWPSVQVVSSQDGNRDVPAGSGWDKVSWLESVCAVIVRLALANLTQASSCFTFLSLMFGGLIVP